MLQQVDRDDAASLAALVAAAAPRVLGNPAAGVVVAESVSTARAAGSVRTANSAAAEAHAASVAAAVAVEGARLTHHEAARQLRSASKADSHTAAARAAADELVLAAAGASAALLVAAAAAGDAKLAEAAAKAANDSKTADSAATLAAVAAQMSAPCISAVRYSDIYSLTDMELYGFAAALATIIVAMEVPTLVGGAGMHPASPAAAGQVATAFTNAHPGGAVCTMAVCGFQWAAAMPPARSADDTIPAITRCRAELVESHDSIPAELQGIKCCSPTVAMRNTQLSLALVLFVVAAGAVLIATLLCREGVTLASAAGMWQSLWVAVLFGVLHCVPRPWMVDAALSPGGQDWRRVRGLTSKDLHLERILGSIVEFCLDVIAEVLLCVVCAGFVVTLAIAITEEQECAPGVLVDTHSLNATEWLTSVGVGKLHRMQP